MVLRVVVWFFVSVVVGLVCEKRVGLFGYVSIIVSVRWRFLRVG